MTLCWLPQYPETQYYCSESARRQRGNFTLLCGGKLCILFSRSHCNVHFQLERALRLIQRGDIDIGDQISARSKATVKTPFKFNKATGKESSAALLFSEQNWGSCTREYVLTETLALRAPALPVLLAIEFVSVGLHPGITNILTKHIHSMLLLCIL